MTDPGLNKLLNWAVRNSANPEAAEDGAQLNGDPTSDNPSRGLDEQALKALMGGPSDADLMREAMAIIHAPDTTLENKLTAFDNYEQLIEGIDNSNNMESLGLWMPLVALLDSPEPDLRRMAAWCISTAVQNNPRAQDKVLSLDALPKLVDLALNDANPAVRKKAVSALSSEVRNYQPGMNEFLKHLPKEQHRSGASVDAGDMDAVDAIIGQLREQAAAPR